MNEKFRTRIDNSNVMLQNYVQYLDQRKYKNETTKKVNNDLRALCVLLNDILLFDQYGSGSGPIS